jgi:hypothetical protein
MKRCLSILLVGISMLCAAAAAHAADIGDFVWDDLNGNGVQDPGEPGVPDVAVDLTDANNVFIREVLTDASGHYLLTDLAPGTYHVGIKNPCPFTESKVGDPARDSNPSPSTVVLDGTDLTIDFGLLCTPLEEGRCWMTGGGSFTTNRSNRGKRDDNWGGNVNPGCSPTAGDGGDWNHQDKVLGLHFHGTHIVVDRCGNVPGIPAGSTSPVTPFNFIEFHGTGWLQGEGSNHLPRTDVLFFGRVEDRGEPGSHGQPDVGEKDRYFLHVWTDASDPIGSTVLLFDQDNDPATIDPQIVSTGNLQLHITGCEDSGQPAARRTPSAFIAPEMRSATAKHDVTFETTGPNPARGWSSFQFGMARDADVTLAVFDVAGRQVRELVSGHMPAGNHIMPWDLRNANDVPVPGGVYFIRLMVGNRMMSRVLTVTR